MDLTNLVQTAQDIPSAIADIESEARNAKYYSMATLVLLVYIALKVK